MLVAQEMMPSESAPEMSVLTSLDDFPKWSLEFVAFLQMKGLSPHLRKEDCDRHSASLTCNAECKIAMNLLQDALSNKIRAACVAANSTSALWETLQQLGKNTSNAKWQSFVKLLSAVHHVTPETLCDFILTMEAQFAEIEQTSAVLDADFKKAFLFTHLPDEYDAFKTVSWHSNSSRYDFLAELRAYNRDTLLPRARAGKLDVPPPIATESEASTNSVQISANCDQCQSYEHSNQPRLPEVEIGQIGSMNVHYMDTQGIASPPSIQGMHESLPEKSSSTEAVDKDERRDEIQESVLQIPTALDATIESTGPVEIQKECPPSEDRAPVAEEVLSDQSSNEIQQKLQSSCTDEKVAKIDVAPAVPVPVCKQQESYHETIYVRSKLGYDSCENFSLKMALQSSDKEQWEKAIRDEFLRLVRQGTLEIVPLKHEPSTKHAVEYQFSKKHGVYDNVTEYRASLCVAASVLREDYPNMARPEAKYRTLLTLLHVAAHFNWEVHHISVSSVINSEVLTRPMWIALTNVLKPLVSPGHFCQVKKVPFHPRGRVYQSWVLLRKALLCLNWKQSTMDQCLFLRGSQHGNEMLLVCGDDLVLISPMSGMCAIKTELSEHCSFNDYGEIRFLFDIKIERCRSKRMFSLDQEALIKRHLATVFWSPDMKMRILSMRCQHELAYLLYLAQRTRPNLSLAVGRLMQMEKDKERVHLSTWAVELNAAWHLLGESSSMPLRIEASTPLELFTYTFLFPSNIGCSKGEAVMSVVTRLGLSHNSWTMFEPINMTFCTSEEKYVAMVTPSKQAMWLQALYTELIPGAGMLPMKFYCCDQRAEAKDLSFLNKRPVVRHPEFTFRLMRSVLADGTEGPVQEIHEKENVPTTDFPVNSSLFSPVDNTKGLSENEGESKG